MAQKTALSVMGTPGRTQSFSAKTAAVLHVKTVTEDFHIVLAKDEVFHIKRAHNEDFKV